MLRWLRDDFTRCFHLLIGNRYDTIRCGNAADLPHDDQDSLPEVIEVVKRWEYNPCALQFRVSCQGWTLTTWNTIRAQANDYEGASEDYWVFDLDKERDLQPIIETLDDFTAIGLVKYDTMIKTPKLQ